MVSSVKIFPVAQVTTAERLALTNIPAGTIVFDSDLSQLFITNDGGATPTWTEAIGSLQDMQQTYDEGSEINFSESPAGGMAWFSKENSISFGAITNAGTGYSVDDILTVSGGTAAVSATIKVDTIGGSGEVITFIVTDTGLYSVDPSPLPSNPLTGGTGNGFMINLNTFQGGSIFFDPGSDGAIDLTGCDHSSLRLPLVPTIQEGFLTTTQAGLWFDPTDGVLKYSDGTEIKTIQKLLSFTEGAVLFGGATGEISESVDALYFDNSSGAFGVGGSVLNITYAGSSIDPLMNVIGSGSSFNGLSQSSYSGAGNGENNVYFLKSRGSQGSEVKVEPGDEVASLIFGGWDGAAGTPSFYPGAVIDFAVDGVVNDGSVPIGMSISCNNLNAGTGTSFDMSSTGEFNFSMDLAANFLDNTDPVNNVAVIDPKKGYAIGINDFSISQDLATLNTRFIANTNTAPTVSVLQTNSSNDNGQLMFAQARGTDDSKLKVETNDPVGDIIFGGWDGAAGTPTFVTGARISAIVDDTVSDGVVPCGLSLTCFNADPVIDTFSTIAIASNGASEFTFGDNFNSTNCKISFDPAGKITFGGVGPNVTSTFTNNIEIGGDRIAFTGNVVSSTYAPCNSLRVIADEAISVGDVLTASTTTDFRVVKVKASDADTIGVIGFAETSASNPGDEILICGASMVTVVSDNNSTITAGDAIEKSDDDAPAGQGDGRVQNTLSSVGTFGVAAQSAGTNTAFKCWLTRSESF